MISHTFFLANLPPWTTNGPVNFHLPHHLFCSKSPVGQWIESKCKSTWGGYHLKSWMEYDLQSKLIQRFFRRNYVVERNGTIERCSLSQSTKFLLKVSSMRKAMLKNANNFAWILQFYFCYRRDFATMVCEGENIQRKKWSDSYRKKYMSISIHRNWVVWIRGNINIRVKWAGSSLSKSDK